MYASYTRLPCIATEGRLIDNGTKLHDLGASPRSTSGLLRKPLDLSHSTTSPTFAWHMYDSPNSIFFQRSAVVDTVNSGVSTLFHPVRNFWRASTVPFYYHLPITLRALNPAARKLLGEIRGCRREIFDRYLRFRVYAIARKLFWLPKFRDYSSYRFDEVQNRACCYEAKRLLPFSSQSVLDKFSHADSASRSFDKDAMVVHLFRNCSINYSRVSDQLMYFKLQVPVLALDDEDDGKHSLTTIDEMNELTVRGNIGSFNRAEICPFLETENAYANSLNPNDITPWFDRSDAPLRMENYLAQHMLPFPTREELYNASVNGARNMIVSEKGVPFNLWNLPVYSRTNQWAKLRKGNNDRKSVRERNLSIFAQSSGGIYDRSKSLQLSPIVETYQTSEQTGGQLKIKNFASLFTVGVNDNIKEETINDSVCRTFRSSTAYDYFTSPNTRNQLFYEISMSKSEREEGMPIREHQNYNQFGVGSRDIIFAVSLEAVAIPNKNL